MAIHKDKEAVEGELVIKIGSLGGEMKELALEAGSTVSDALSAAGFPEDSEVRCSGEVYTGTDSLEDGDRLIVLAGEKIKGGR